MKNQSSSFAWVQKPLVQHELESIINKRDLIIESQR